MSGERLPEIVPLSAARRPAQVEVVGDHIRIASLELTDRALAGYLDHPVRGLLAFSIMVNNANAPAFEIRAGVDKLVKELLE